VKKKDEEAPVVHAARELAEAIDELEHLTSRTIKNELTTRGELVRGGELLTRAAQAHRDFLGHLGALTQAVAALRDRQNASAGKLSEQATRFEARRLEHEALEQRFASLGAAAREIGEIVKAPDGNGDGAAGMKERLGAAKGRLADAVEAARVLAADARTANFSELESQAHAIRQQIQALLQKIELLA
jgi:hypothetical protein